MLPISITQARPHSRFDAGEHAGGGYLDVNLSLKCEILAE
jgi:hypothetical protein